MIKNINKVSFEVLGNNLDWWAEQFINDLENLYVNEDLVLVGGYSKVGSQSEFEFVMYKTLDRIKKEYKFDFEIETIYGNLTTIEFENYLNQKYNHEKMIYICSFVINRKIDLNEIYDDSNFQMRIIVFQNMKINFPEYNDPFKFTIKSFPCFSEDSEKEIQLMNFIDSEHDSNNYDFLGILPDHSILDSYLIYFSWDENDELN